MARRQLEPYRQGGRLDGLYGVSALINAVP